MALNFMGLGFTFGGKDLGLSQLQESVTSGFEKMSRVFDVAHNASMGVSTALDDLAEKVTAAPKPIEGALGGFAKFLKGVAHNVETNNTLIDRSLKGLSNKVKGTFGPMQGSFSGVGAAAASMSEKIKASFSVLLQSGRNLGSAFRGRFESIRDKFGEVRDAANELVDAVATRFPRTTGALRGMVAGARRVTGILGRTYRSVKDVLFGISDGFDHMNRSMEGAAHQMRRNVFGEFFDHLRNGREALQQTAAHVANLTSENRNLTTGLEATMQANATSARRMGANFGLVGRDLNRFTSRASGMALGMNVSVDTAAQATFNWSRQMQNLRAVGLRSAADLVRLQEVTGTSSQVLADSVGQMRTEFHFSDQAMQALTSSAVAAGRSMGNVGGQLQHIPELLGQLRSQAALAGERLTDMQLADRAQQVNALAAGFRRTGSSFEDANTQALAISGSIVEAQRNIGNMFAGTETELGSLSTELGVSTGDISRSFDLMNRGPQEMVQGLMQMVQQARRTGHATGSTMNFLRGRLQAALGPDQAERLMTFFNTADQGVTNLMHDVRNSRASLRQVGTEGFRTGRTLAESFDLAEQSFISSFRNIGRRHAVAFVNDTTREFGRFNHSLQAITNRGGPLAVMVERMSEIHQIGTLALLPQTLRPMAAVFGTMLHSMLPTLQALGAMSPLLSHLMNPWAALAGAVGGTVFWFEAIRESGARAEARLAHLGHRTRRNAAEWDRLRQQVEDAQHPFRTMGRTVQNLVRSVVPRIRSFAHAVVRELRSVDWSGLVTGAMHAIVEGLQGLNNMLRRVRWGRIARSVLEALGSALSAGVPQSVIDFLEAFARATVDRAQILISALLDVVGEALDFIQHLNFDRIGQVFERLATSVAGIVQRLVPVILDGVVTIVRALPGLFVRLLHAIPALMAGIGRILIHVLNGFQAIILGVLEGIRTWLVHRFPQSAQTINRVFAAIRMVVTNFFSMFTTSIRLVVSMWTFLGQHMDEIIRFVERVFIAIWNNIVSFFTGVWNTMSSIVTTVANAFRTTWNAVAGFFTALWNGIRDGVRYVWGVITGLITDPLATIQRVWNDLTGFFGGIFSSIRDTITADIRAAVDFVMGAVDRIRNAFGSVMDTVRSLFGHSVNTIVGADMEQTVAVVRDATSLIQRELEHALFDAVVRALVNSFRSAMQQITQFTTRFVTSQTDAYGAMIHRITDMWQHMWRDLLAATDTAVIEMERRLARAMIQLQSAVANARAQTTAILATAQATGPAAPMAERRLTGAATMDDLVRAVDRPLWWTDPTAGGVALLTAIVNQLATLNTAIVQALAAARGGPGGGAARPGGASRPSTAAATNIGVQRPPVAPNLNPGR